MMRLRGNNNIIIPLCVCATGARLSGPIHPTDALTAAICVKVEKCVLGAWVWVLIVIRMLNDIIIQQQIFLVCVFNRRGSLFSSSRTHTFEPNRGDTQIAQVGS